ncbi:MAG: hypothetical protein ACOY3P_21000 [Planctomycetota bacterium]
MDGNDDKTDSPFDAQAAAAQVPAAAAALLAALKAKRAANAAATAREFALKSVRGLEPVIVDLFDSGATLGEVFNILQQALPAVAPAEMRYALAQTRERYRLNALPARLPSSDKASAPAASRRAPRHARAARSPTQDAPAIRASCAPGIADLPSWADGSDRRPDESDADYALRKNLEGPPEARRKFIDDHNI